MAKRATKLLPYSEKLVLNLWLIELFGIDVFANRDNEGGTCPPKPIQALSKILKDCPTGLDEDGFHFFYKQLLIYWQPNATLQKSALLQYEENILSHTARLNESRDRPIEWKYYQWLSLLFAEIYLHQYFSDRSGLKDQLNAFVAKFNKHWEDKGVSTGITPYSDDELNKLCLQNATGSGKTLLMHINYRQFGHYAHEYQQHDQITRTLLITPNEGLSSQHEAEMIQSGIMVSRLVMDNNDMFSTTSSHLAQVDYIEITKLGEKDGDKTIATRNLGDQNLILVDEGHRGMGKAEEEGWYKQRERLTEKGFAFEYSATFKEAVKAAGSAAIEATYAKSILFDYSYRYFYEDGYGKDYRIFNIPSTQQDIEFTYLTGCLLSFYQQLRLFNDKKTQFADFNLDKPLWVFVGSSVSGTKKKNSEQYSFNQEETATVSDLMQILTFFAQFLASATRAQSVMDALLTKTGQQTGMVTHAGVDIFHGAFLYLKQLMTLHKLSIVDLHKDILTLVFNNSLGGQLSILRLKGDSGELVLSAGDATQHFGLINVGDANALANHIKDKTQNNQTIPLTIGESSFLASQFAGVKHSNSPINLLIGSKKFVEGWDSWRVSTLGLMRVGRSEGAQIIQLFGRGVRLKGYNWSLKRSTSIPQVTAPEFIGYMETLNVFGIQADYMEQFKKALEDECLPSNDSKQVFTIPMNVTYDFGVGLKVLAPKKNKANGKAYNFNADGAMPMFGDTPELILNNKIVVDWYPKIQAIIADGITGGVRQQELNATVLTPDHLGFLDFSQLYFDIERYKAKENLYSLIIQPDSLKKLLHRSDWYVLYVPENLMTLDRFDHIYIWQQIALELLKKYAKRFFMLSADAFIRPRLEVRAIAPEDENIPQKGESYQLVVNTSEAQLIADIQALQQAITPASNSGNQSIRHGHLSATILNHHLYEPLLFLDKGTNITVSPVTLNDSEQRFVTDLMTWLSQHQQTLNDQQKVIYLLRNRSRGKGLGFFEAGNFYPDFILWIVEGNQQKVIFIEPHGISHEGPKHPKIQFHKTIKDIQARLKDPALCLESFVITPTAYTQVQDRGLTQDEWAELHLLFMDDTDYLLKMFTSILN